jgi:SAM-dependent methyltransferase
MDMRSHVRRATRALSLNPVIRRTYARARFGDLDRIEPVSSWGTHRGRPVDRWYVERYLTERSDAVRGNSLEVKDDLYSSRFGASSVDVVDIDAGNERATVVGDLCAADTLAPATYDVAVVTQTLQLVPDPALAVQHLVRALRPGGSLLLTVPTMSRIVDGFDRWRWTPAGMRHLLTTAVPSADVEVAGLGNGLTARAFLFGLAADDLAEDVLATVDERYPLVVGAWVRPAR